ncbi:phosphoribosyltransferase [Proteobacteria bacterium 005FR1]|nr:phosphoribosyltransferase [Proteobacteria bacterium 005FR1]
MAEIFQNRIDAGRRLAAGMESLKDVDNLIVLALPRGGVPVAAEVAKLLRAPLDVLIVRKVGLPNYPELAMGAVASGDIEVVNKEVVTRWGIGADQFKQVADRELEEVERRDTLYRRGRGALDVADKIVVLVDDGVATGSTIKAAIAALRKMHAQSIVVGVPVAAPDTLRELQELADEVVCVDAPAGFRAVGGSYQDFSQTTDEEVCRTLRMTENR